MIECSSTMKKQKYLVTHCLWEYVWHDIGNICCSRISSVYSILQMDRLEWVPSVISSFSALNFKLPAFTR